MRAVLNATGTAHSLGLSEGDVLARVTHGQLPSLAASRLSRRAGGEANLELLQRLLIRRA
jgi:hypothetical protein